VENVDDVLATALEKSGIRIENTLSN